MMLEVRASVTHPVSIIVEIITVVLKGFCKFQILFWSMKDKDICGGLVIG